jgi:DNA-binding CsgD family transcriptional regulator
MDLSSSRIDNHICLTSSEAISQIARPLFEFLPVNYFRFFKLWADGSYIRLSTHPAWTYHYMTNHYNFIASPNILFKPEETSFQLFDISTSKNKFSGVLKAAKDLYDLDHGLSIQETFNDYIEIYDFTAASNCYEINELYLQYMDSIKKFIRYFRSQAQTIIEQAEKNKFKMFSIPSENKNHDLQNKERFEQQIELDYLKIHNDGLNISLTKRETQCVIELIQGSSNKMIGKKLNLSQRTVDSYMENIKIKLNCNVKSQIIKKVMQNYNIKKLLLN